VLQQAQAISAETDGAFDVTAAALFGLWDFKAPEPTLPADAEIEARRARVDYRKLVVDPQARTAQLLLPEMRVGLGAIAKGYVVDRVCAVLAQRGFPDHLVVAGGDLYASGAPPGRRWRVAIRHPADRHLLGFIEVQDQGVATSGNYEKFFLKDGVRYHHLLDPATGRPARGLSSATAVARSAMLADAYATALFVLGRERALALARTRSDLEALLFDEQYRQHATAGLAERIRPLASAE